MNPVDLGLVSWVEGELEKFLVLMDKNFQKDASSCWWYPTIDKVVYEFMYVYTLYPFNVFVLGFLYSALEILTT